MKSRTQASLGRVPPSLRRQLFSEVGNGRPRSGWLWGESQCKSEGQVHTGEKSLELRRARCLPVPPWGLLAPTIRWQGRHTRAMSPSKKQSAAICHGDRTATAPVATAPLPSISRTDPSGERVSLEPVAPRFLGHYFPSPPQASSCSVLCHDLGCLCHAPCPDHPHPTLWLCPFTSHQSHAGVFATWTQVCSP